MRSTLVLEDGEKRWPAPAPPPPPPSAPKPEPLSAAELELLATTKRAADEEKRRQGELSFNAGLGAGAAGLVALGAVSPSAAFRWGGGRLHMEPRGMPEGVRHFINSQSPGSLA